MAENICKASELKRSSLEIVTPTEPHSIPINWWPQKNILTPPNRGRDATLPRARRHQNYRTFLPMCMRILPLRRATPALGVLRQEVIVRDGAALTGIIELRKGQRWTGKGLARDGRQWRCSSSCRSHLLKLTAVEVLGPSLNGTYIF